jgi:hypothetical protein
MKRPYRQKDLGAKTRTRGGLCVPQSGQIQQQTNLPRYEKAYGTCLAGRGSEVR